MTVGPVASTATRHPDPANGRLAGFTVAVTAQRRAEELVAMLRRTGAEVCRAPALRIVPLSDDQALAEASHSLLGHPPDIVVATTGVGFRGWLEACETLGLAQALIRGLATARVLARGPKAKGAVRAAGLREEWSPPSESSDELLGYLLDRGVAGARIAVQLHGEPLPHFCRALRHAGAQVVPVPVYRWTAPADLAALDRLIEDVHEAPWTPSPSPAPRRPPDS
ncbi:uroporphyrinogen-III synthase [Spiractinospora alimapuensis]|uniref:uroporphyrinogen-III synthase n=1 Tax=Spiractinospora alimapuensis TaxID=2820884 RepID=UPI003742101C